MADPVYGFNKSDATKLCRILDASGIEVPRDYSNIPDEGPRLALAYTTDGITGRSGTTPGSGTATLKKVNDGTLENLDPTIDVTAYNLATDSVAAAKYLMLIREYFSGLWFVVWEEC
jgi:hypothetical protein